MSGVSFYGASKIRKGTQNYCFIPLGSEYYAKNILKSKFFLYFLQLEVQF